MPLQGIKPTSVQPWEVDRAKAKRWGVIGLWFLDQPGILQDTNPNGPINTKAVGANAGGAQGSGGRVLTFNGSQSLQMNGRLYGGGSRPLSYVVCARIMATGTQGGTPGQAFGIDVSTKDQGCFGPAFDPSNNVGCGTLNSNGAFLPSFSAGSQNVWYTVYTTVDGSSELAYAWINGAPATTQGAGTGGTTQTPFDEYTFGAQNRLSGVVRNFTGNIEWAAVLYVPNQQMTDGLARQLYDEDFPYSLINRSGRRIYFTNKIAAGGVKNLPPFIRRAA